MSLIVGFTFDRTGCYYKNMKFFVYIDTWEKGTFLDVESGLFLAFYMCLSLSVAMRTLVNGCGA